jgi:DNA-binding MarR family transcriptional regulator
MTNTNTGGSGGPPASFVGPASLPWLLRRTNQRYRAAIRDRLAECGFDELPQPGYWALMVLARGGTDASELISEMGVSKQAVSKLVDALVTMGFVERKPNRSDRRRSDLRLSAKGGRAADVIGEAVRTTEESFVNELGSERFTDLVQMLAQVNNGANQYPGGD